MQGLEELGLLQTGIELGWYREPCFYPSIPVAVLLSPIQSACTEHLQCLWNLRPWARFGWWCEMAEHACAFKDHAVLGRGHLQARQCEECCDRGRALNSGNRR